MIIHLLLRLLDRYMGPPMEIWEDPDEPGYYLVPRGSR